MDGSSDRPSARAFQFRQRLLIPFSKVVQVSLAWIGFGLAATLPWLQLTLKSIPMKSINSISIALVAFAFAMFLTSFDNSPADVQYEFTSFTVVESIIPNGMGRSRIIHATEERDYREFTSIRTDEIKNETSPTAVRFE